MNENLFGQNQYFFFFLITHADDSRWSKAFSGVCLSDCDCLLDNSKTNDLGKLV